MAEPVKISQEEYDEFRKNMEDKYHYEDMTDEEQERFEKAIDQVAVVDDGDDDEEMDGNDLERERDGKDRNEDDDDEYIR